MVVDGVLRAFDAEDVSVELWNSDRDSRDQLGKFAKFPAPTVANGKVFVATFSNTVRVYGLRSTTPPPAGATPYGGTPAALPGTIQAENFDDGGEGAAYHDGSSGNDGGAYRATDVDIESSSDAGGGWNVGWMSAGEWLQYTVNVAAGTYTLDARVASEGPGGTFHVEVNGVDRTGPLVVPDTGGWQSWRTVTRTGIALTAGVQVLRVVLDADGSNGAVGNLNYLRLTPAASGGSIPFGGTPVALPGRIEAANFDAGGEGVAYHDTTAGNEGGAYRDTDVDIEASSDAGGGVDVGWMRPGEWLQYTVTVSATGVYTLDARVACPGAGATFHVEANGVDVTGPMSIPDTGDWQSWTTVTKAAVSLAAGQQTLRLIIDAAGASGRVGNVGYMQVR
jgi:hypothetical protein